MFLMHQRPFITMLWYESITNVNKLVAGLQMATYSVYPPVLFRTKQVGNHERLLNKGVYITEYNWSIQREIIFKIDK